MFADELKAGDQLQKADGSNLTIDRVEFVLLDEPVMVYNFTVEEYHTYYVTDIGIWVHNTNCPFNIASGKSSAIDVTSSAKQHLTGQVLNNAYSMVSQNKDVVFATQSQALEFINKKFGDLSQDVAQKRSANGWHYDNHPVPGYGDQPLDHKISILVI